MLVIAGILLAFVVHFGRSGRSAGHVHATVSAGQAYSEAIETFARDHHGRYPSPPPSDDWSSDVADGPADPLARRTGSYLRSVPEQVQAGHVVVAGRGPWGGLDYSVTAGGADFQLDVVDPDGAVLCSFGSSLPATSTPCNG